MKELNLEQLAQSLGIFELRFHKELAKTRKEIDNLQKDYTDLQVKYTDLKVEIERNTDWLIKVDKAIKDFRGQLNIEDPRPFNFKDFIKNLMDR